MRPVPKQGSHWTLISSETNPHAVLGAIAAARDYNWTVAAEHFDKAVNGRSGRPRRAGPTRVCTSYHWVGCTSRSIKCSGRWTRIR